MAGAHGVRFDGTRFWVVHRRREFGPFDYEWSGDLDGIEEAWTPVAPLDTPVTRLDWTRGALTLNAFDLRLDRMLSERAYLGLEYYTSTADSATRTA